MELDPPHSIEVITVTTTPAPGGSGRSVIPLQIELEKYPTQQEIEGHDNKMRRPVRPIDRQRMRPWLMELLDLGNVFGLRWTNRHQGIFQISWRHASRLGWNLETDGDVFERWARHTGIYKEGDPPEPKRWKANFRCALHSLNDVIELTNAVERRGSDACRTYRFLQSGDDQVIGRKRAKAKKVILTEAREAKLTAFERDAKLSSYERSVRESLTMRQIILDPTHHEGIELQSEEVVTDNIITLPQEKVIVQKMDIKSEEEEEFGLQHDHDYSAGEKTEKTIVLRQGIGSIVLQKEIFGASEHESSKQAFVSNLDQLASAAMSSAGYEETEEEESESARTSKKGRNLKNKKLISDIDETIRRSDLSLKLLLTGKKGEEQKIYRESQKEDRSDQSLVDGSKARTRKMSESKSPAKNSKADIVKIGNLSPPSPPLTRQKGKRSASPKICGRKSKRGKKDEDGKSESTEPLMSSCLLLLEAATRLDKAEKHSTSSTDTSGSGDSGEVHTQFEVCEEETVVETVEESEVPMMMEVDLEEEVYIKQETVNESDTTTHPQFQEENDDYESQSKPSLVGSPGILRTTLENIGSELEVDLKSQAKDVTSFLDQYTVSVSGGKITLVKDTEAKGLFSGSSIQSEDESIPSDSKIRGRGRGPGKLTKEKYFVDIRSNSGPELTFLNNKSEVIEETAVEYDGEADTGTAEYLDELEVPTPADFATVQSTSGVQQTVVQRSLPVLNASSQLSNSANATPVFLTRKISGLAGTPQILMSSSKSPSQSNAKTIVAQKLSDALNKSQSFVNSNQVLKMKNYQVIPKASPIITSVRSLAPESGDGVANLTRPKAVGPRTIILTRPQKSPISNKTKITLGPSVSNKDTVFLEPKKEVKNQVKLHILQKPSTSQQPNINLSSVSPQQEQVSSLYVNDTSASIEDEPNSSQTVPAQSVNVTAQIIFDPVKGPMLKFPIGPPLPLHSSVFQPQHADQSEAESTESSATFITDEHSDNKTELSENNSHLSRVLATNIFAKGNPGAFIDESGNTINISAQSDEADSSVHIDPQVIVSPPAGFSSLLSTNVAGKNPPSITLKSEQSSSVQDSLSSNISKDLQQAFTQCLSESEPALDTSSTALEQDDNGKIRPLSQMCKGLLSQYVRYIDNQTTESEASDSVSSSPCVQVIVKSESHVENSAVDNSEFTEIENSNVSKKLDLQNEDKLSLNSKKFDSIVMMDPTAPLSLGEVPLFAASKGDSDSMSPNSDVGT